MDSKELKLKYLEFFKTKNHAIIPSASLIPENDPTVLFTTAGMHPLVPFLLGQPHPSGKRLADVQKCIRTSDIDSVGDDSHLTFFEMLGNWSLGDYFKKEAIEWSFEFLTKILGFDKEKISVTCFEGDKDAPKDTESAKFWEKLGISRDRIYFLPKKDNWWGPAGETGPCGPCTEIFIDTGKEKCSKACKPGCSCEKYIEIWNDVFMEFNKEQDGTYKKLKKHNVDTGMGVERTTAMLNGKKTVYEIENFTPIVNRIKEIAYIKEPNKQQEKSIKIITDHIRAATFILGDNKGIAPSNIDQGYILRRFIRRSIRHGKLLGIEKEFLSSLAEIVINIYKNDYEELKKNKNFIIDEIKKEDAKFRDSLNRGLKQFEKFSKNKNISGKNAFLLFQSFGFPLEITEELAKERGIKVNKKEFGVEFKKHQELSRKGAEKKFKGGLSDASEQTIKLHTAAHLLNEALRKVLKNENIHQKGSNITPERLRFDFNFDRKLTDEEIKKVENLVNEKIKEKLKVERKEMKLEEAKKIGAHGVFEHKYRETVSVYSIGKFSIEICGGPHVKNTSELNKFKIIKEESIAAGVRRIKAVLE